MVAPRFQRTRDPVISVLCRDYGDSERVTAKDVRDTLQFAPYKSVAPKLIESKSATDKFVVRESDQDRLGRSHLQNKLHGLELQRLELERQAQESRLGHQEGNVQLREIAALVGDVTSKLNAIENEQASFNMHIHDLRSKNDELAHRLQNMKAEELRTEKSAADLAEEKARLAQRLAEVTQEHTRQQKILAEQSARRVCVEESLTHLHQDASRYAQEIRDLADKRRALEKELKKLKFSERETEKRIGQFDDEHSGKMKILQSLISEIEKTQQSVSRSMPLPEEMPPKANVRPVPLSHPPPTHIKAEPVRRLALPRAVGAPEDYSRSTMSASDVEVPQVDRGVYQDSVGLCVPEPPNPRLMKDDTYYSSETTRDMLANRHARPHTTSGTRTRYVGLNTVNAAAAGNFGTGLYRPGTGTRPFVSTDAPHLMDTTYGHYYGREGRGAIRSMMEQRS